MTTGARMPDQELAGTPSTVRSTAMMGRASASVPSWGTMGCAVLDIAGHLAHAAIAAFRVSEVVRQSLAYSAEVRNRSSRG